MSVRSARSSLLILAVTLLFAGLIGTAFGVVRDECPGGCGGGGGGGGTTDTVAPTSTDDVPSGWRTELVTVTLSATDTGGSGVASITYRVVSATGIDGATATYSDASKPVLRHGERIRYFATDSAGNAEGSHVSAPAQIDHFAPVTTDDVPATWQKGPVTVTLSATDTGGSLVAATKYQILNAAGTARTAGAYSTGNKPVLGDGEKVRYWTTDGAGNVETAKTSSAAKVDQAAPTTTDNVPSTWSNTPVSVTLAATDTGGSGLAAKYPITWRKIAADGAVGVERPYDAAKKPTLGHDERLEYRATDAAGNGAAWRASNRAKVDQVTPTTTDDVPATWQKGPVTVTLSATDTGGSLVAATKYQILNAAGTARTAGAYSTENKPVLGDGEKVRYWTTDGAGNVETAKTSSAAKVDEAAPTTTDDVPTTWQNTPVTVTLSAADTGGSGIAKTEYEILDADAEGEPGATETYSDENKPVLGDGETVRYWTTDEAGNAETKQTSIAAKVDEAAPTTTDDVPTTWQKTPVTVTLSPSDTGGSGVAKTEYEILNAAGTARTAEAYSTENKPVLGDGETVRYWTTDEAGNAETATTSSSAQVDEAAPTTTDDVPTTWQKTPVTVTLSPSDTGGSGVAKTEYEILDAEGEPGATTTYTADDKPVLGDGETVRYWTTDGAGNVETAKTSSAAKVDEAAPTTTDDVPTTWQNELVTVTLSAADTGGSGIAKTEYEILDAEGEPGATETYSDENKPVLGDGETVRYWTTDEAGNAETATTSSSAQVDEAAPTTTDDVPTMWQKTPVTVTLSPGDTGGSGIATTTYAIVAADGTAGETATYDADDKPVLQDGEKIQYATTDEAGNAEELTTSSAAMVDQTAPATTDDVPATYQAALVPVTLTATDDGGSDVSETTFAIVSADGTVLEEQVYDADDKPALADGEKIQYFSTDGAGNVEETNTSAAAQVDTAVPSTSITGQPASPTSDKRPAVTFGSDASTDTFECSLDDEDWTVCTSPYRPASALADGDHALLVRGINRAGVPDPTPALVAFAVDTKAPAGAAPLAGPPASSSASTQTFAFAGEPGATFLCALDAEPLAPCTSPVTRTGLTVGQHRFRVVQVDAAGNRSAEQVTAFEITKIAASSEKQDTAKAARAMLGRGGRSIVTLGRLTIGCATDQGPLSACGGQVVDGKGVVLARGAVKATGGATSVALTLFRTQEGRNALRRQPLGVKAFIELALTTPTGRTLTTRTPTTLIASNQIVMLNGRAGKLTQTTRTQLTELAKTFRTGTKVSCVAHVDKRASAARDRKITTAQAQSACALIKQLAPKIVTTAKGLGHSVPRATNRSAAGRTRNQRMVITFTL